MTPQRAPGAPERRYRPSGAYGPRGEPAISAWRGFWCVFWIAVALAVVQGCEERAAELDPVPIGVRGALEAEVAGQWCRAVGGELEVRTRAGTRVDCVTSSHAVEVERAAKWAEAVGQALHYAAQTNRRAGIVLMLDEGPASCRFLARLESTVGAHELPITVWALGPDPAFACP